MRMFALAGAQNEKTKDSRRPHFSLYFFWAPLDIARERSRRKKKRRRMKKFFSRQLASSNRKARARDRSKSSICHCSRRKSRVHETKPMSCFFLFFSYSSHASRRSHAMLNERKQHDEKRKKKERRSCKREIEAQKIFGNLTLRAKTNKKKRCARAHGRENLQQAESLLATTRVAISSHERACRHRRRRCRHRRRRRSQASRASCQRRIFGLRGANEKKRCAAAAMSIDVSAQKKAQYVARRR